jgi:hypothetical protein
VPPAGIKKPTSFASDSLILFGFGFNCDLEKNDQKRKKFETLIIISIIILSFYNSISYIKNHSHFGSDGNIIVKLIAGVWRALFTVMGG